MKKWWFIIKEDFIKLVNDFYSRNLHSESINTSLITLIQVNDPENMNDYKPISLVSLPLKFLTKLMANRLQKQISLLSIKTNISLLKVKVSKIVLDGILSTCISPINL
jgi:predicted transcriptional regulator YheO